MAKKVTTPQIEETPVLTPEVQTPIIETPIVETPVVENESSSIDPPEPQDNPEDLGSNQGFEDVESGSENYENDDVFSMLVNTTKQLISELDGVFIGGLANQTKNRLIEILSKLD